MGRVYVLVEVFRRKFLRYSITHYCWINKVGISFRVLILALFAEASDEGVYAASYFGSYLCVIEELCFIKLVSLDCQFVLLVLKDLWVEQESTRLP